MRRRIGRRELGRGMDESATWGACACEEEEEEEDEVVE